MRSFGQNKSGDLVALGDEISETGAPQRPKGGARRDVGRVGKSERDSGS